MAWVSSIIAGVIANSITSISATLFVNWRDTDNKKEQIKKLLDNNPSLSPILQKASASVAKFVKVTNENINDDLKLFLISPEVESLTRQIYASQIIDKDDLKNIELIRLEFRSCMSLFIKLPQNKLTALSNDLFSNLLEACETALSLSIDKGILSAHEAKSVARHRLLLDELANIKKNLDYLKQRLVSSISDIVTIENKYREQVANRYQYIIPPDLDTARKIHIKDLYVTPSLINILENEGRTRIDINKFFSKAHRCVILGNPGAGKSTLAQKITYELSTRYKDRLFAERQVTPLLVILRDYGAKKKEINCSFVQFLELTSNSNFQLPIPTGILEHMLLNGRVIVIFDGLDELLDTSSRREVSGDIESFCNIYPSVPVIVTSREIGYERAPLDENIFTIFQLAPFNDEQVKEYATKWFSLASDLSPERKKKTIESFLTESEIVPDLRSNPLMLSLICNIYRGENYIPRNRPDVYEKCALMLFERWDKSRNIRVQLPFEEHVKPAMMHLAYWIYSNEELQAGVTTDSLAKELTNYLYQKRYEDKDEALSAAKEFIEFCSGRAWVFSIIGEGSHDNLYQFTHRTFLEYFTAAYLARLNETSEKLVISLINRIKKREWDVVAQLAFQIKYRNYENAGEILLGMIIDESIKSTDPIQFNLLSFATRCLEFMVPGPQFLRRISTISINKCFDWTLKNYKNVRKKTYNVRDWPSEIIGNLFHSSKENIETIVNCTEQLLIKKIKLETGNKKILAIELALNLSLPYFVNRDKYISQNDTTSMLVKASNRIYTHCAKQIIDTYPHNFEFCYYGLINTEGVDVNNLVEWYGIDAIFRSKTYILFPNVWSRSYAETLLAFLIFERKSQSRLNNIQLLIKEFSSIGKIILSAASPLIKPDRNQRALISPGFLMHMDEKYRNLHNKPDNDCIFGIFVVVAAFSELILTDSTNRKRSQSLRAIRHIISNQSSILRYINKIILSRFRALKEESLEKIIESNNFSNEQEEFIRKWVNKEHNLIYTNSK